MSCLLCGISENEGSRECASCVNKFCLRCVKKHFGKNVNRLSHKCWYCDWCGWPAAVKHAIIPQNASNLEAMYSRIKLSSECTQNERSFIPSGFDMEHSEKFFASLFCSGLISSSISDLKIADNYLKAGDALSVMFRISPKLRTFFRSKVFLIPGLFKTFYGQENQCRLHDHQVIGLNYLTKIENRQTEFGALRGGIFGDEPGLGKTVTCLALIASSAGSNPVTPEVVWDEDLIEFLWSEMAGQHKRLLLPVINALKTAHCFESGSAVGFRFSCELDTCVTQHCENIEAFTYTVKELIAEVSGGNVAMHDQLLERLKRGLDCVKEGLDINTRKDTASTTTLRVRYERSLTPTHATLIIVPETLLEHWFEQIQRHLNLNYFTRHSLAADEDCHGIVYIDGLGDMADIQPPISKLFNSDTGVDAKSAEFLSHYLIVVTTYERCVDEYKRKMNGGTLLLLRWLRLVVDEGHEIGKESASGDTSAHFISRIAAERRWVMSGTPTSGTDPENGLVQLYRLLSFLRHPLLLNCNDTGATIFSAENTRKPAKYRDSFEFWRREFMTPCLKKNNTEGWDKLGEVLRSILVRHTKDDLCLYEPTYSTIALDPLYSEDDLPDEVPLLSVDRAQAKYIADTMVQATAQWKAHLVTHNKVSSDRFPLLKAQKKKQSGCMSNEPVYSEEEVKQFRNRRPKGIVFSQIKGIFTGAGHFLYLQLGDQWLCEHFGKYRSSELSRFRHSKRKYRQCPLCGYCNSVAAERYCENHLFVAEYLDVDASASEETYPPAPGGHGALGPGGHYTGRCLCSPLGCGAGKCSGYKNAFASGDGNLNPNLAIITTEDVEGWQLGDPFFVVNQLVTIKHRPAAADGNASSTTGGCFRTAAQASTPLLWRDGVLGGRAVIRYWQKCGGWHGDKVLRHVPWRVEEEPACILLLKEDGSTGLDLSFATHIFLLEHVDDPALLSQIVSRAHRMGATGPVEVQLLEVKGRDK